MTRIFKRIIFLICVLAPVGASAQELPFPAGAQGDVAAVEKAMPAFADQLLATYKEENRVKYLDNLFRLQIVGGHYTEALQSLVALDEASADPDSAGYRIVDRIFVRAKIIEASEHAPFAEAFRGAFRRQFDIIDYPTSALVIRQLTVPLKSRRADFENAVARQKDKNTISLADALSLIRAYQLAEMFGAIAPFTGALIDEDDRSRYITEKNIQVKTPGGTVCAHVMRPRSTVPLPALLEFTVYNDANPAVLVREMRRTASNGYVSVVGFTRGKACSPDQPVPYEHDGADAAALIDWISQQSWSDQRVGMYGGSYSGFTPWAAVKFMPKALKAIMIGAAVAPGIDVPMEGNIVWNFIYTWPFYAASTKTDNDAIYNDRARWQKLESTWYTSGRAFRDLDKIDPLPNPVWQQWIAHSAYDAYWQNMIPYQSEFARINIPVLNTAGYYYGGPGAAVYYFTQHLQYNPKAEHYLLIGPYDHFEAQRGTRTSLGQHTEMIAGYRRDPEALIDITELRYKWFNYIFKGWAKPAILQDKVNYEVTDANVWKHAPSIAAMSTSRLRLHLTTVKEGTNYKLNEHGQKDQFITQTINFADRSDADKPRPGGNVLDKEIDSTYGLVFVSQPFTKPTDVSGLFSGLLDFTTNRKDFDFQIDLYKLTPRGEYLQLAPYWARASYVQDRTARHLLIPGKRQRLNFESIRLMSSQFQPGSRLVAVLSVIKESGRQINYGSGKPVIEETIADAGEPLQIKWYGDSYIDIPIRVIR